MRVLAIDCATEACSVALFEGGTLRDARHTELGRGHAERLVPMIAELPRHGRADEIRVGLGPGSFTGTRIALAAARALGIAWNAQVLGMPTLALVAASHTAGGKEATVCMAGGHGEWLVQNFDSRQMPQDTVRSLPPEQAARAARHLDIIGNRAAELADIVGDAARQVHDALPDARNAMLVDRSLLTSSLSPIYGRPPDAKLPA